MESENWLPVVGFPCYEVSDLGRVKRVSGGKGGVVDKILKPCTGSTGGYAMITLYPGRKRRKIHQLVLEAFIGPRPENTEGCHSNRNPSDNRLVNLRWDTHSNNQKDSSRPGELHHNAKLTWESVREIRKRYDVPLSVLAQEYGVSPSTIRDVIINRSWIEVSR